MYGIVSCIRRYIETGPEKTKGSGQRGKIRVKKYIQLYNTLREKITSGALTPGTQLQTENQMAGQFGVSRQTVRQALEMLRHDGFIYSVQGSGSFVGSAIGRAPENRRIAVVTTYFSEYIFPSILRGISEAAVENGYTIEINTTNNSISAEKAVLKNIMEHPVAGIIVEGTKAALPNPNTVYYQQLAQQGIPIVFINSIYPGLEDPRIVSVVTDDFNGGYRLAKKLIAEHHALIGCIFKSDDAQGINRFSGVMSALADNNVEYNDTNFFWFSTETKHSFMPTLISGGLFTDCTALVCYNDEVVSTICSYLKHNTHNIRAIASFDCNLNLDLVPSGIEFISLPHPRHLLGKTAAHKLFNMLAGKVESSVVLSWGQEPAQI